MRLTTDRRIAMGWLSLFAAIALMGCDNKPKPGNNTSSTSAGLATSATAGRTPRQVAEDFLKDLSAGKVTPARLAPGFKKLMTHPTTEQDKALGYSDNEAREFLTRFEKANFVIGEELAIGPFIVVRGRAELPESKVAFSLRLTQRGDEFLADWLHLSQTMATGIAPRSDPDLAGAQDAVRNFLDIVLGGDLRQAHALMSPAWKKSLAPPTPADDRKGFDYDPGFLTQKTRSWKGDFVGYSLPKAELAADKGAATFTAELDAGASKTLYTVLTVKDKPSGQWLIESFSKQ
jgi:hypothetical protein